MFDYLVVGAGFAGSVLAEHLASVEGQLLPFPITLDTINRLYGLKDCRCFSG